MTTINPLADFNAGTLTKLDTAADYTLDSTSITVSTMVQTADGRLTYDYGAGGISSSFRNRRKINISFFSTTAANPRLGGYSTTLGGQYDWVTTNANACWIHCNNPTNTTTFTIYAAQTNLNTASYSSASSTLNVGTDYYIEDYITESGGTFTYHVDIYSDAYTTLINGLTRTLAVVPSYRYLYLHLAQHAAAGTVNYSMVVNSIDVSMPTGSGTIVFTGSGVGASTVNSIGSGNIVFTGTGVGASLAEAVGSGNIVFTGSGVGSELSSGDGVGSGNIVFTGSGVGASLFEAVGSGAIVFTGIGVGDSAIQIYTNLTWRVVEWDDATSKVITVSGLSPTIRLRRRSDLVTVVTDTMVETDSITYPGVYDVSINTTTFGTGADEVYQIFVESEGTSNYYSEGTMCFRDGLEQWGGLSTITVPTAAENAAASLAAIGIAPSTSEIRTELAVELARIDIPISTVSTSGLTADEIAIAVGNLITEGTLTLKEALVLASSIHYGNATIATGPGSFIFRSNDGTNKIRIQGTIDSSGTRTISLTDAT